MGLPIRLVTVVNSNDIIHRTVQNGDFSLAESVKATLASAMDIQVCSELVKIKNQKILLGFFFFNLVLCSTCKILPLDDALGGVAHIDHFCYRLLS